MFITIQSRIMSCPVCYYVQIDITQLSEYECETWSHTLWKQYGLRVFRIMVLRRIFGPDNINHESPHYAVFSNLMSFGGSDMRLEKLHNGELHNLNCSQNLTKMIKSRRKRWSRHASCMGHSRIVYFSTHLWSSCTYPLNV